MSDWIKYSDIQPEEVGLYEWRVPHVSIPDLVVDFVAMMRNRGAGYATVLSPSFDYWDGYKINLPENIQWREVTKEGLKDGQVIGVNYSNDPPYQCPYCESMPRIKGCNRGWYGGVSIGAYPIRYNSWRLECCQWTNSPRYEDPRSLIETRNKCLLNFIPSVCQAAN